ncbi:hypothetical protein ACHAQJ_005151 [Trichoderma viride]
MKAKEEPQEESFPTLAYIGPNDIRYLIIMLACMKAGHKALLISPRNSLEGQMRLFEATNCNILFYAEPSQALVEPWLKARPMRTSVVSSADAWLQAPAASFSYEREFDEAQWDPVVVLHTSGTTGFPKPITIRQGVLSIADAFQDMTEYQGSKYLIAEWIRRSRRIFTPMPLFHIAGTLAIVVCTVFYGAHMTLGIPGRFLTAELVAESIAYAEVDAVILPPSIIEDLSLNEEWMEQLTKLAWVGFGGGNLKPATGDELVKRGIPIVNIIGSTEFWPYPLYHQPNPELWQYFVFDHELVGAEWRPVAWEEDIYELVIRRKDRKDPGLQIPFYTFPDLSEWSTGDLYKPHPTLPLNWCYYGRIDDVIVFSNGEKLNPISMEETIAGHPAIRAALIVGQDRFQPALILEPVIPIKDKAEAEVLIDSVWPFVKAANRETVQHGQIVPRLIALSDPDKPFNRTPKGTVQRYTTRLAYKDYIDLIYQRGTLGGPTENISLDFASEESLSQSIINLLSSKFGLQNIDHDTDFFRIGLDSLQVLNMSSFLRSGFVAANVHVDSELLAPRAIYRNQTPKLLAAYLLSTTMIKDQEAGQDILSQENKAAEEFVIKYTENLPPPNTDRPDPLEEGQTIILTGSTGSLGSYLLERLCALPRVKKIVVFNRSLDGGRSRQSSAYAARGLYADFSKVEFCKTDLSSPGLGLSSAKYNELLASADRIIHNAWPVNFNFNVASFEPSIRGVRNLVDFAGATTKRVPIVFVSSISASSGWAEPVPVPEKRLDDMKLAQPGYGQSKLAASLILDAAAERSAIPTASVRLGQVAGPRSRMGEWNRQEYLPSLIASSVYLGFLPKDLGNADLVDWMPVEDVAGIILDVAGVTTTVPLSDISGYFHAVNPVATPWSKLVAMLKEYYGSRIEGLVSLDEWVAKLENSASETIDVARNPALKLVDTYKHVVKGQRPADFETARIAARSPTMAKLGSITSDLVWNWCDQWAF